MIAALLLTSILAVGALAGPAITSSPSTDVPPPALVRTWLSALIVNRDCRTWLAVNTVPRTLSPTVVTPAPLIPPTEDALPSTTKLAGAATDTAPVLLIEPVTRNVPSAMVVLPVYVLAPFKVSVVGPDFVSERGPPVSLIAPLSTKAPALLLRFV